MTSVQRNQDATQAPAPFFGLFQPAIEFAVDAAQRSVLFWDVMRQRGDQYREHLAETAPNVLDYEVELVLDGRTLERPVNYVLARVVPPQGTKLDPTRRPFVIVDPRAGHAMVTRAALHRRRAGLSRAHRFGRRCIAVTRPASIVGRSGSGSCSWS